MALQTTEKQVGNVTVLELFGRITLGEESTILRNKIKTLVTGKPNLVLDLGNVSYIDSAGLGTLVSGYTSAANQGTRVVLANLTKRLNEQLSITKLVTVFETYNSVEDAVKALS